MGESDFYFLSAVLGAISIIWVFFCIVSGKGISHKMLVFFTSLLCVLAMICFGGEVVLNHFGMGWRCTPFNIMLILCVILFTVILCFGMRELMVLENANPIMVGCGFISMVLAVSIILITAFGYFYLSSWHDGLTTYNDQTIVYANDQHGGSCDWRYYTHINDLVHGVEILQEDGWIGKPPRNYNQTESN